MRPEAAPRRRLRSAIGIASIVALLCAGAALADTTLSPPAEKFAISPGGVDMRSGRYVYNQTDLSIGGDSGLSFTRSLPQPVAGHSNPFANFSHNWDILLTEKRVDILGGDFRNGMGNDYQIEISFGGLTQTFRANSTASIFAAHEAIPVRLAPRLTNEERAHQLADRAGSNTVSARSNSTTVRVDLRGRPHGDVPTPHTPEYTRHINPNNPARGSMSRNGPTRPVTPRDLRTVDRLLRSRGQ
jgi:hypothetical protein